MMMALPNRVQYLSTAPNPEIRREKQREQEEERRRLEKSKKEFHRKNAARNNKMKMSAALTIFFMATGLFVTIFRSGMIYNMQNEYVQMQIILKLTLQRTISWILSQFRQSLNLQIRFSLCLT